MPLTDFFFTGKKGANLELFLRQTLSCLSSYLHIEFMRRCFSMYSFVALVNLMTPHC